MKANSRKFIRENFPDLINYKIRTSRRYESTEKPWYRNNWSFNFMETDLASTDYIVLAGALDHSNRNFKVFKVPSTAFSSNLDKISIDQKGWINLYTVLNTFVDSRHPSGNFSLAGFDIN